MGDENNTDFYLHGESQRQRQKSRRSEEGGRISEERPQGLAFLHDPGEDDDEFKNDGLLNRRQTPSPSPSPIKCKSSWFNDCKHLRELSQLTRLKGSPYQEFKEHFDARFSAGSKTMKDLEKVDNNETLLILFDKVIEALKRTIKSRLALVPEETCKHSKQCTDPNLGPKSFLRLLRGISERRLDQLLAL